MIDKTKSKVLCQLLRERGLKVMSTAVPTSWEPIDERFNELVKQEEQWTQRQEGKNSRSNVYSQR
jgi:thymidylate kinase